MSIYNNIANGATFIVDETNLEYHTKNDWGLAITNTDYIGEPEQQTKYVEIPGGNTVDLSEVIMGGPVFSSRQIKINLSGIQSYYKGWDTLISTIRNCIHGRKCKIIFDNDKAYYYYGRVSVKDFGHVMTLGSLTIEINAEPYKYNVQDSTEAWLWDSFNFIEGSVNNFNQIEIPTSQVYGGYTTVTVPKGRMEVAPEIIIHDAQSTIKMLYNNSIMFENLSNGILYDPRIRVNGSKEAVFRFYAQSSASYHVSIKYRSGSL